METVKNFKEFSNGNTSNKLLKDLYDAVDEMVYNNRSVLDFEHDGMGVITNIDFDQYEEELYCTIKNHEDKGPQEVKRINVQYNLTEPGSVLFAIGEDEILIPVEDVVIDQELIDNIKNL